MKQASGAIVDEPQAGSPAAKAGIQAGDVIVTADGAPIKDANELARTIAVMTPGTTVKLGLLRNGEERTISLTLGQLPNERTAQASSEQHGQQESGFGLSLAPADEVAGAGDRGVAVLAVDPDSNAAEHGVQAGDVILAVAGESVSKPADVTEQLARLRKDGRHAALMQVKHGKVTRFIALPFGEG